MTKVKICGITNYEDAVNAAKLGADYLGFNFYKKSPRYIEELKAREIINQLPKRVKKVGVFANEHLKKIKNAVDFCNIDLVQLSGDEDINFILNLKKSIDKKIIKCFRIKNEIIKKISSFRGNFFADYIMIDSFKEGFYGGTGSKFDWRIIKGIDNKKKILAGGLNASNVREAIDMVNPYAVDVCSSIEKYPGKKDFRKMKEFIYEAKHQKKSHQLR